MDQIESTPVITPEVAQQKMKKFMLWGIVVVALLLLSPFVYTGLVLYQQASRNSLTDKMTQWFPYPAAIVNGEWIRYSEVNASIDEAVAITEKFSDDTALVADLGALPTPAEIADEEYDRLVQVAILEQLALEQGVEATPEEIDTLYEQAILSQVGGDEQQVASTLEELYGWTVDEFKQKVVRELVLRDELQTKFIAEDDEAFTGAALLKIQDVQAQVQADPGQFAELAKQYSEDGSAANGGDLDWFGRGVMVPEFEEAVFALTEPNQVSDIVQSQFGYHLIQLIERKAATDTEEEQVHARHILIKYSLDDYISTLAERDSVKRLIDPKTLVE